MEINVYDDPEPFYCGQHFTDDQQRAVLTKAAECLRNGVPATFTGAELDLVRHVMPAHEVHQSGSVRWVLERFDN